MLNKGLSQAIFYNTVLLVEGGSEYTLFETVLNFIYPEKEIDGKYTLQVDGVGFKKYTELFDALDIVYFVQTDNDLQRMKSSQNEYMTTGFKRGFEIINKPSPLQKVTLDLNDINNDIKLKEKKKEIFDTNKTYILQLKESNIYLSEI
ncbi:ATP-dependent endonuclease, partial [Staphylococcus cohnii]